MSALGGKRTLPRRAFWDTIMLRSRFARAKSRRERRGGGINALSQGMALGAGAVCTHFRRFLAGIFLEAARKENCPPLSCGEFCPVDDPRHRTELDGPR